jgi:hypothetical protein
MDNWTQLTSEPECLVWQPSHRSAAFRLPLLLVLLSCIWLPRHAIAQFGQLIINPISNTNVTAGMTLAFPVSVTNISSGTSLVWTLGNAPTGATITTNTITPNPAIFSWTPTDQQTGTVSITVNVVQFDNTANHTNASFAVTVNEMSSTPTAPILGELEDKTIAAGMLLTFTAYATNTDNTTNTLTFSLDPDAPEGATITNLTRNSAVFNWRPTAAQSPGVYTIDVTVTENNDPSLTDIQTFTVNVILTNNCPNYDQLVEALTQGGFVVLSDCPTLVLSNTIIIANDVTIEAGTSNVLITGNNLVQLFTVMPDASLTLNGVTLSAGRGTNGGAVSIMPGGLAVISDCVFAGNGAVGSNGVAGVNGAPNSSGIGGNGSGGHSGSLGWGGAIFNAGDLTLVRCQFLTNEAAGGNGGAGGDGAGGRSQGGNGGSGGSGASGLGGAIYNSGTISVEDCSFDNNTATGGSGGTGGAGGAGPYSGLTGAGGAAASGSGAALYSTQIASSIINRCTFSGNSGTGGNGAKGGTLSSNFGSNGARGGDSSGGAICNLGTEAVTNCTFFANQVNGGNGGDGGNGPSQGGNGGNGGNAIGGGIYTSNMDTVVNCTVVQNAAKGGTNGVAGTGAYSGTEGSPGASRGGGVARTAGTFYLQNSILVTNTPGANAYGTITDGGKNLSSDASLTGASRKNVDPKLESLAGDPPQTMALKADSPAIDKADDSAAPEVDERGTARPVGPHSDIGAYEYPTSLFPEVTVSPGNQTILVGNSVTFTATAMGQTPLTYQWQFNNANISHATASVYTLTNAQTADTGDYTVTVSNQFGTTTSLPVTLTVNVPVYFTISGRVLNGTNPLPDVTVTADTNAAVTDITGAYTISGVSPGDYFVFASKAGYNFGAAQEVSVGPSASNIDFTVAEQRYNISGRVVLSGGGALSGVGIFGGRLTDANGAFNLSLPAGTYILTPSKTGFSFDPPSLTVVTPPDATNQDFVAGWLITSVVRNDDGTVRLFVTGAGQIRIETSSNLVDWVSIYTNTAPFAFTNTTATDSPLGFYRAVAP